MISKNQIKFLSSLLLKKNRVKHQKIILEGYRLISESILAGIDVEYFCITKNYKNNTNGNLFDKFPVYEISEVDLKKIADTKSSQGIIALVDNSKYQDMTYDNLEKDNLVILDGIQDPGNMGTIFRTCAWFGVKTIILTSNCSDPFNSKCLRSGVGSHFYFKKIITDEALSVCKYLMDKKYEILIADLDGKNICNYKKQNKWALVLGSEAHGISDDFKNYNKITIPKKGNMESLNVSVSSGIILNQLIQK